MKDILREYYKNNPKDKKIFCPKGFKESSLQHITILNIKNNDVIFAFGKGSDMNHREEFMTIDELFRDFEEIKY